MIVLGSLFMLFAVCGYLEHDAKADSKPILKDRDAFNKSFRE